MNRLGRALRPVRMLPAGLQPLVLSLAMGRAIPFVGTAGLRVDQLTNDRCVVRARNQRRAQNHIKSVHAAAMALAVESATGFVVGMNVQDSCVPVIKRMNIAFVKRSTGDITAEAWLTAEQIALLTSTDKGEVTVGNRVTDSKGVEPIKAEMIWAWTPKRR